MQGDHYVPCCPRKALDKLKTDLPYYSATWTNKYINLKEGEGLH